MSEVAWDESIVERQQHAASVGVQRGGDLLLRLSNDISPTQLGDLDDTGHVEVDGLEGAVGYDSEYARKQHEMAYYAHPRGDQPKFLERSLTRNKDRILATMVAPVQALFRE